MHDFTLVRPSMLAADSANTATEELASDREGPASAPTMLAEVYEIGMPTVLPAPPRVPHIAIEGWPTSPSPVPVIRPALALVQSRPRAAKRPPNFVPLPRSQAQLRAVRPSRPPSAPPPARPMGRVA